MKTHPDKYDRAVRYLTNHPEEMDMAWVKVNNHPAGCLFDFAGPIDPDRVICGCLTQVRAGVYDAVTDSLTRRIRADKRIPTGRLSLSVASLPIFAVWQRKLDKYAFRRKKVKA